MRIIWLAHSNNPAYAGVRLRCLIPQGVLGRLGHRIDIPIDLDASSQADIVVVQGKWLLDTPTPDRLLERRAKLERAKATGAKLLLDSFDNYFLNERKDCQRDAQLAAYRSCLSLFDRFTVSSPGLVGFLQEAVGVTAPITVIGDPLEMVGSNRLYESPMQRLNPGRWFGHIMARMQCYAARTARRSERRLMWYGNHGSTYARGGMVELARILPSLQDIATRVRLHLTVVSNSRDRYDEITSLFRFSRSYYEWDRLHFASLLQEQDLVLLPSIVTPFTISKSNNRLLLSLAHGVPVVTDSLPDYVPWREYCAIDKWDQLEEYIYNPINLKVRAAAVADRLIAEFSPQAISNQWLRVFQSLK